MLGGCDVKPISCGAPRVCVRRPWAGVLQYLQTSQNNYCLKDRVNINWKTTQDVIPVHVITTDGGLSCSITVIPSAISESPPRPSMFDEYIQYLPYWERLLFSKLDMSVDCNSLVQQFTNGALNRSFQMSLVSDGSSKDKSMTFAWSIQDDNN
eukprot:5212005-Ditylum_brightwellii.AAC.3